MPELPEVEVTRRGFADRIDGATVRAVRLGAPLRWPLGCAPQVLHGAVIGAATRRGKYLWLPLAQPATPAGGLLLHLGMSGSLAFHEAAHEAGHQVARAPAMPPPGRHDHFDLDTSRGLLRLTDPRRFGAVVWSPGADQGMAARLLGGLGREPFDAELTPQWFHAALQRRGVAIKAALLGGDIVVGAGNIYACAALFAAGIDPRLPACRLSRPRAARLLEALRSTLARAIELGGSSLRDFRDVHGMDGAFQAQAAVYGRAGLPCPRCGAAVRRIVQNQRSTFFCPRCQRR